VHCDAVLPLFCFFRVGNRGWLTVKLKVHPLRLGLPAMMKRFNITMDTNLINIKQRLRSVNILEHWHEQKLIELVCAYRLEHETEKYNTEAYRKALSYRMIKEPGVFDVSYFDHFYFVDGGGPGFNEVHEVLFPNVQNLSPRQTNDVMFLLAHIYEGCDFFVSNDSDFIKCEMRRSLREHFGVNVFTPEEMVKHLEQEHGFPTPIIEDRS